MQNKKLTEFAPGLPDITIRSLCFDSRKVEPGDVFFAIPGFSSDGHDHLNEVIKKNPAALVVENPERVPKEFLGPVIKVSNARRALDQWASRFNNQPGDELFCIGVTGTNGKTTSVYMIEAIFNSAGRPTGVMGTIDHHLGSKQWPTSLTTPDPITIQARLREFVNLGAKVAAFEVSSIALDQERVSSIPFDVGLFTNFTRDHLDYHGTMEKYFAAKKLLFEKWLPVSKKQAYGVLNADDSTIAGFDPPVTTVRFGQKKCEYQFEVLSSDLRGSRFRLKEFVFELATPGTHNVYNAVGALAVALEAGVTKEVAAQALSRFHGAPGRLETVPNQKGLHIFVDYAHTDDALKSVLQALRNLMKRDAGALWVVFGCGGDRDRGKRPLMMKAASSSADRVVLTSDNPRTEDPDAIIRDCLKDFSGVRPHIEVDRKKAIAFTLQSAREGDVILVAGKGHEDYQIVGDTKFPFSDVSVIKELLR